MSTHHASPGEVVNLMSWDRDIPVEHSKAIAKTAEMELARLIFKDGAGIQEQHVDGPLIIHCLSGCLDIQALGADQRLGGGELLYLPPGEHFSLRAERQAVVLLTFIFR